MIIIQNAQSGRFQGKVTESQLIDLMNQMSEIDSKDSKIEIKRQKFDDDEELDIDNMGF
jgi:DNA-binding TFAR19-related protein (PDSD5 family)